MLRRDFHHIALASLLLCTASCHTPTSPPPKTVSHQSTTTISPHALLTQKLGGPLGYDVEMEDYLKKVVNRLSTLSTFRAAGIDLKLINHNAGICIMLDGNKLLLSRGLLVKLDNEAELIAAIVIATLSQGTLTQSHIQQLSTFNEAIDSKDFMKLSSMIKGQNKTVVRKDVEEIITSLGYAKTGVLKLLGFNEPSLIGLQSEKLKQETVDQTENKAGYLGEASFQKMVGPLKALQKAYDYEISSILALNLGQLAEALELCDMAIDWHPAEAHFYFTKSTILNQLGDKWVAFEMINQAICLNPDIASYYVARSEFYKLDGRAEEAQIDLKLAQEIILTTP
jgi:predicted Zn-dependent protease